jgi:hypothetical protein
MRKGFQTRRPDPLVAECEQSMRADESTNRRRSYPQTAPSQTWTGRKAAHFIDKKVNKKNML